MRLLVLATVAAMSATISVPFPAKAAQPASLPDGVDPDAACYLFAASKAENTAAPLDRQKMSFNLTGFYAARVTAAYPDDAKLKAALKAASVLIAAKGTDPTFIKQLVDTCLNDFTAQYQRINSAY